MPDYPDFVAASQTAATSQSGVFYRHKYYYGVVWMENGVRMSRLLKWNEINEYGTKAGAKFDPELSTMFSMNISTKYS